MLDKWLIINDEEGYIVAGQVRETFGDGFMLVWSPTCTGPAHMHLYDLAEMAESETLVFNSKDEMDAYIAWMEGPSTSKKGKVIKLHPKHGDEARISSSPGRDVVARCDPPLARTGDGGPEMV